MCTGCCVGRVWVAHICTCAVKDNVHIRNGKYVCAYYQRHLVPHLVNTVATWMDSVQSGGSFLVAQVQHSVMWVKSWQRAFFSRQSYCVYKDLCSAVFRLPQHPTGIYWASWQLSWLHLCIQLVNRKKQDIFKLVWLAYSCCPTYLQPNLAPHFVLYLFFFFQLQSFLVLTLCLLIVNFTFFKINIFIHSCIMYTLTDTSSTLHCKNVTSWANLK